jgi:hypothetical protein
MVVISTGIFVLAVLFSMIQGIGFFVSLALLVLGCFGMITVGILRESPKNSGNATIALPEADDVFG